MGIQNDLNVIHNYRKTLLHLTMLTSIITAAAAATATIEPKLPDTIPSSTSPKEDMLVVSPLPTGEDNNENRIMEKDDLHPAIPFCDDTNDNTIGRR